MIKLTQMEKGIIFDGIGMLKHHYRNMSEEELDRFFTTTKEEYINTLLKLYSTFNALAYDDSNVYIDDYECKISKYKKVFDLATELCEVLGGMEGTPHYTNEDRLYDAVYEYIQARSSVSK